MMARGEDSKEELDDILSSIRAMIDEDKKFFVSQSEQTTDGQIVELTSMINERGKVTELPPLKRSDSPVLSSLPAGGLEADIKQKLDEAAAGSGVELPQNSEEIIRAVAKAIIREWTATELPRLAQRIIAAEIARIRLAKGSAKSVDK